MLTKLCMYRLNSKIQHDEWVYSIHYIILFRSNNVTSVKRSNQAHWSPCLQLLYMYLADKKL